eukprot:359932-Chlamydomonas_euryale.AAC.4
MGGRRRECARAAAASHEHNMPGRYSRRLFAQAGAVHSSSRTGRSALRLELWPSWPGGHNGPPWTLALQRCVRQDTRTSFAGGGSLPRRRGVRRDSPRTFCVRDLHARA